jgi:hypothetical protein
VDKIVDKWALLVDNLWITWPLIHRVKKLEVIHRVFHRKNGLIHSLSTGFSTESETLHAEMERFLELILVLA